MKKSEKLLRKAGGFVLTVVGVDVDVELVECHPGEGGVEGGDVLSGVLLDPLVTDGRSLLAHRLRLGVHYDCCVDKKSETKFRKTC